MKRPCSPVNRIGFWQRHGRDAPSGGGDGGGIVPQGVGLPPLRVAADNEQISPRLDQLVPYSGRDDDDVARLDLDGRASLPAKTHGGPARGDPEHLVGRRMVVVKTE